MSHQRMGAVALQGLRNVPTGTRKPARKVAPPPKVVSRTHVCSPECSCRRRQAWQPYVTVPQVAIDRRDGNVPWLQGGGIAQQENTRAIKAWANVLVWMTPGRKPSHRKVRLADDVAYRARMGISTSTPITMPEQTKTIKYAQGVVATRNRKGVVVLRKAGNRATATEGRDGKITYGDVEEYARKWGRKGHARPFAGRRD